MLNQSLASCEVNGDCVGERKVNDGVTALTTASKEERLDLLHLFFGVTTLFFLIGQTKEKIRIKSIWRS
jgi:hypothetical protein